MRYLYRPAEAFARYSEQFRLSMAVLFADISSEIDTVRVERRIKSFPRFNHYYGFQTLFVETVSARVVQVSRWVFIKDFLTPAVRSFRKMPAVYASRNFYP